MPRKNLIMLLMILSLITSCGSNLKKTRNDYKSQKVALDSSSVGYLEYAVESTECSDVLKKCSIAVDKQKITIDKQGKVIETQDELIKLQKEEVERSHKSEKAAITGGVSVSTILLLLLLL